jgi:hypothetical protein
MEENFKRDVIQEVRSGNGRILLHDEVEERPNVFSIVPLWETVSEEDIMTPGDVFELMAKEGYKVSVCASVIRGMMLSTFRRLITVALLLCVGNFVLVTLTLTPRRQMNKPLCQVHSLSFSRELHLPTTALGISSLTVRWVVGGQLQAWSLRV